MTVIRRSVKILGSGTFQPGDPVFSAEIDRRLNVPTGFIEDALGIEQRYFAKTFKSSEMGAIAAKKALDRAGIEICDIDLVISASAVMEQPIPTLAILIQEQLKMQGMGIPALDINTTCLSFLSALDMISYAVEAGAYRNVLLVSSEMPSCGLDWSKPEICGNFGDGAAAAVISKSNNDGAKILGSKFESYCEGARHNELKSGGTLINASAETQALLEGAIFRMDGPASYRLAARHFRGFIADLLKNSDVTMDDIDAVIPHQASAEALLRMRRGLRIPEEKFIDVFGKFGNQISASIPTALHEAIDSQRVSVGDNILLIGTAAGLTLGGLVMRL